MPFYKNRNRFINKKKIIYLIGILIISTILPCTYYFNKDEEEFKIISVSGKNKNILSFLNKLNLFYEADILTVFNFPNIDIFSFDSNLNLSKAFRDNDKILQGFYETKHKSIYSGVLLSSSIKKDYNNYFYTNKTDCYISKHSLFNKKNYFFVQIFINEFSNDSFNELYQMFTYLKDNFKDPFIISGYFGIKEFDKIFFSVFSKSEYNVIKNLKIEDNIIKSFDGVFISNKLFNSIEYKYELFLNSIVLNINLKNSQFSSLKEITKQNVKKYLFSFGFYKNEKQEQNKDEQNKDEQNKKQNQEIKQNNKNINIKQSNNFNNLYNFENLNYFIFGMNRTFYSWKNQHFVDLINKPEEW